MVISLSLSLPLSFLLKVTGLHTYVGRTAEYLLSPFAFPGKLRVNSSQSDVQTLLLQNALISLTTGQQPMLIDEWTHIHNYEKLDKPENAEKKARVLASLARWQQRLRDLTVTVEKRNKRRVQPFYAMKPDLIESSIAV